MKKHAADRNRRFPQRCIQTEITPGADRDRANGCPCAIEWNKREQRCARWGERDGESAKKRCVLTERV